MHALRTRTPSGRPFSPFRVGLLNRNANAGVAVLAGSSDGQISCQDTVYANARGGAAAAASAAGSGANVGQLFSSPNYFAYEAFLRFDLLGAGVPAGATIRTAALSLWVTADNSTADFVIEARTRDWGATVDAGDWVAGASLSALTLLASLTTAGLAAGAYNTLTNSGTNLVSACQTALAGDGVVKVLVCSDQLTAGNTPVGFERVTIATVETSAAQAAKLTVTY